MVTLEMGRLLELIIAGPLNSGRALVRHLYSFTLMHIDRRMAKAYHLHLKQEVIDSFSFLFTESYSFEAPNIQQATDIGFDYAEVVACLPRMRLTVRRCRGEIGVFVAPVWSLTEGDDLSAILSVCESRSDLVKVPFSDLWRAAALLQDRLECVLVLLSVDNYGNFKQCLEDGLYSMDRQRIRDAQSELNHKLYGP
jgi:hypothetical protein